MERDDDKIFEEIKIRVGEYFYTDKYANLPPQLVYDFGVLIGLIERKNHEIEELVRELG